MKYVHSIIICLIVVFCSNTTYSQTDTTRILNSDSLIYKGGDEVLLDNPNKRKPQRAMLLSAIIPGAGQVYNRKLWKVPLVYSALGTTLFFFNYSNKRYYKYLKGYQQRIDTTLEETIFDEDIGTDVLREYKNKSRRNRDLSIVVLLAVYGLNIIDAYVDAHLSDFDISDNLSLNISPVILYSGNEKRRSTIGLTLCFNFK